MWVVISWGQPVQIHVTIHYQLRSAGIELIKGRYQLRTACYMLLTDRYQLWTACFVIIWGGPVQLKTAYYVWGISTDRLSPVAPVSFSWRVDLPLTPSGDSRSDLTEIFCMTSCNKKKYLIYTFFYLALLKSYHQYCIFIFWKCITVHCLKICFILVS